MPIKLWWVLPAAFVLNWLFSGVLRDIRQHPDSRRLDLSGPTTTAGGMSLAAIALVLLNWSVFAVAQAIHEPYRTRWPAFLAADLGNRWDGVTLLVYGLVGAALLQWLLYLWRRLRH
ncbi:MAG: hypothetical protein KDI48_01055 [Xanthomonadales bacterium]|nr:hypothetical protein [Xanthomonadales bacterium]